MSRYRLQKYLDIPPVEEARTKFKAIMDLDPSSDLDEILLGDSVRGLIQKRTFHMLSKSWKKDYVDIDAHDFVRNFFDKHEKTFQSLSTVFKTASLISELSKEKLPDLKILRYMTDMPPDPCPIKLMLVIDATCSDELRFSNVINHVSDAILQENDSLSEIMYINRRDNDIDFAGLKKDYPIEFNPTLRGSEHDAPRKTHQTCAK